MNYTFIYLFLFNYLCFTPASTIFHLYDGSLHYSGKQPVSTRWKPAVICRLLENHPPFKANIK